MGGPQKVRKAGIKMQKLGSNIKMEDRRRTRSEGPMSLSEETELIQWGSLQDPVRIKRSM